ncbi:MAG: four-helix bundle copper-binding protein [Halobacteriales archaeon]|nr:four-helix bundle copper-binding protein [Halobacteriales archaeon]
MPHQQHAASADAAQECHRVCAETLSYCLEKGGKHAEAAHIQLLLDCANICTTCGDACSRGGEAMQPLMKACAEVCNLCADSCEQFGNDKQMQRCADACGSGTMRRSQERPARSR